MKVLMLFAFLALLLWLADATDCPTEEVVDGSFCPQDGTVCNWGEQLCCGGETYSEVSCTCSDNKFECLSAHDAPDGCDDALCDKGSALAEDDAISGSV
eukprot:CAMPEP_0194070422 /NCGR_PEP_ID=MMETSP0009_2-20130614/88170_1 /TAXON_ID=210454 /ORGANISM="Grammatophora oceanica, Strain CCMP 410" /LENGTH=98 /DNA_ID=CAMNT_0038723689 /DNA_START=920 /DNA_END=1213 /DNA_ORIENTATION=-